MLCLHASQARPPVCFMEPIQSKASPNSSLSPGRLCPLILEHGWRAGAGVMELGIGRNEAPGLSGYSKGGRSFFPVSKAGGKPTACLSHLRQTKENGRCSGGKTSRSHNHLSGVQGRLGSGWISAQLLLTPDCPRPPSESPLRQPGGWVSAGEAWMRNLNGIIEGP